MEVALYVKGIPLNWHLNEIRHYLSKDVHSGDISYVKILTRSDKFTNLCAIANVKSKRVAEQIIRSISNKPPFQELNVTFAKERSQPSNRNINENRSSTSGEMQEKEFSDCSVPNPENENRDSLDEEVEHEFKRPTSGSVLRSASAQSKPKSASRQYENTSPVPAANIPQNAAFQPISSELVTSSINDVKTFGKVSKNKLDVTDSSSEKSGYSLRSPIYDILKQRPCLMCKKPSTKRCSRCKVGYCSTECQANHWPDHREKCVSPPPLEDVSMNKKYSPDSLKDYPASSRVFAPIDYKAKLRRPKSSDKPLNDYENMTLEVEKLEIKDSKISEIENFQKNFEMKLGDLKKIKVEIQNDLSHSNANEAQKNVASSESSFHYSQKTYDSLKAHQPGHSNSRESKEIMPLMSACDLQNFQKRGDFSDKRSTFPEKKDHFSDNFRHISAKDRLSNMNRGSIKDRLVDNRGNSEIRNFNRPDFRNEIRNFNKQEFRNENRNFNSRQGLRNEDKSVNKEGNGRNDKSEYGQKSEQRNSDHKQSFGEVIGGQNQFVHNNRFENYNQLNQNQARNTCQNSSRSSQLEQKHVSQYNHSQTGLEKNKISDTLIDLKQPADKNIENNLSDPPPNKSDDENIITDFVKLLESRSNQKVVEISSVDTPDCANTQIAPLNRVNLSDQGSSNSIISSKFMVKNILNDLEVHKTYNAYVTVHESHDSFNAMFLSMNDDQAKLIMDPCAEFLSGQPLVASKVFVGDFVIAQSIFDSGWYRAIVINAVSEDEKKIEVCYVDYGNCEFVERMKSIPEKYRNIPGLSVDAIYDSSPNKKELDKNLHLDAQIVFKVLVKCLSRSKATLVIDGKDIATYYLESSAHRLRSNCSETDNNFNRKTDISPEKEPKHDEDAGASQEKTICYKEDERNKSINVSDAKSSSNYKNEKDLIVHESPGSSLACNKVNEKVFRFHQLESMKIEINKEYKVILICCEGVILCTHLYNDQNLMLMGNMMEEIEVYSKTAQKVKPRILYSSELVCAIEDNTWCRAVVTGNLSQNTTTVKFIDYGNVATISRDEIYNFDERLLKYPVMSVRIMPVYNGTKEPVNLNSLPISMMKLFIEHGALLTAKALNIDSDRLCVVCELFDEDLKPIFVKQKTVTPNNSISIKNGNSNQNAPSYDANKSGTHSNYYKNFTPDNSKNVASVHSNNGSKSKSSSPRDTPNGSNKKYSQVIHSDQRRDSPQSSKSPSPNLEMNNAKVNFNNGGKFKSSSPRDTPNDSNKKHSQVIHSDQRRNYRKSSKSPSPNLETNNVNVNFNNRGKFKSNRPRDTPSCSNKRYSQVIHSDQRRDSPQSSKSPSPNLETNVKVSFNDRNKFKSKSPRYTPNGSNKKYSQHSHSGKKWNSPKSFKSPSPNLGTNNGVKMNFNTGSNSQSSSPRDTPNGSGKKSSHVMHSDKSLNSPKSSKSPSPNLETNNGVQANCNNSSPFANKTSATPIVAKTENSVENRKKLPKSSHNSEKLSDAECVIIDDCEMKIESSGDGQIKSDKVNKCTPEKSVECTAKCATTKNTKNEAVITNDLSGKNVTPSKTEISSSVTPKKTEISNENSVHKSPLEKFQKINLENTVKESATKIADDRKLKLYHLLHPETEKPKPVFKLFEDCQMLKLPIQNNVSLAILYSEDPSKIFAIKHSDAGQYIGDLFEKLQPKMQEYCESITEHHYVPKDGEMCLAKFSQDGSWYRAACIQVSGSSRKALMMFVDYGNQEVVSFNDIVQIADSFLKLPLLALHCSTKGFDSSNISNIKREALELFKETVCQFSVHVGNVLSFDDVSLVYEIEFPQLEDMFQKMKQ